MQLNYSLFPACAAHITPFLPGASEWPVSAKLVLNTAGYNLEAEGTSSQRSIGYELKFVGGKQPAAGECKDGTAALAGLDAQTGDAVLSVRMADGAKNDVGCNLVVNKK